MKHTKGMALPYTRSQSKSIEMNLDQWTNPPITIMGMERLGLQGDIFVHKSTRGYIVRLVGVVVAW